MNFLAYIIYFGGQVAVFKSLPPSPCLQVHISFCAHWKLKEVSKQYSNHWVCSLFISLDGMSKNSWEKKWAQLTKARLDEQCQWLPTCFIHAVSPMGPPHMQSAKLTWYRCLPMMGFYLTMLTCHPVEVRPRIQIETNYYMDHVGRCRHQTA